MGDSQQDIIVFSTSWCPDCRRSKKLLEQRGTPFTAIDIEEVSGAEKKMLEINGGYHRVPTIILPDGTVLMEPSNPELTAELKRLGL
ncbi:MAG: glutaredoxin family protein [Chloroflexi bacterium]|nr:glutaredoxin family protein [Chloroflexota bacterium]